MDWVAVSISLLVKLSVGTVVTYVALVLGCLVAIEGVSGRRLVLIALVSRSVSTFPLLLIAVFGSVIPKWSVVAGSIASYVVLVPLLAIRGSFPGDKAAYISIIATIFMFIFSLLAIGAR